MKRKPRKRPRSPQRRLLPRCPQARSATRPSRLLPPPSAAGRIGSFRPVSWRHGKAKRLFLFLLLDLADVRFACDFAADVALKGMFFSEGVVNDDETRRFAFGI